MRLLFVPFVMGVVLLVNTASVYAQSEFVATLRGGNEVPPVDTIGFGSATFDVNVSGGDLGIDYELTVTRQNDFVEHRRLTSGEIAG